MKIRVDYYGDDYIVYQYIELWHNNERIYRRAIDLQYEPTLERQEIREEITEELAIRKISSGLNMESDNMEDWTINE